MGSQITCGEQVTVSLYAATVGTGVHTLTLIHRPYECMLSDRLILQQESEIAKGGIQMMVTMSMKNSKELLRINARNPISLTTHSLELTDDFHHLTLPTSSSSSTLEPCTISDITHPQEEAALTKFCSRLCLVDLGQVRRFTYTNGISITQP